MTQEKRTTEETFHVKFSIPRKLRHRIVALSTLKECLASQLTALAIEEFLDTNPEVVSKQEELKARYDPFLPQRVIDRLKKAASGLGVSMSDIVCQAIKGYLNRNPLGDYDEGLGLSAFRHNGPDRLSRGINLTHLQDRCSTPLIPLNVGPCIGNLGLWMVQQPEGLHLPLPHYLPVEGLH